MRYLILLLCLLFVSCSTSDPESQYDLVLANGKIWTGEASLPWAKWVAVKDNKIAEIGEDSRPPDAKKSDRTQKPVGGAWVQ